MKSHGYTHTNHLIHESSPYLLQHAHNPVDWYPWGQEALDKAREENKPIIVSIGYAACHWCHVMEHESFNDEEVATFMNENFVSIKVDREERPDIDQVYMHAVQLITGSGGWPLNCIALPDGRPVYGGTYFPRAQWLDMLTQVLQFVKQNPEKAERQAEAITQGVQSGEITYRKTEKEDFSIKDLHTIFTTWKEDIDYINGGHKGAPKFPLPIGYQFLLHYHYLTRNAEALEAVTTTLHKMADGGIYDQIGGGFARYATDPYWRVPHFEKMLYDNAQLVSLYSAAYRHTKGPRYQLIVHETLDFIQREMTSDEGGFYSSYDADSEGDEGRFYIWTKSELHRALGGTADPIIDYYSVTDKGNWEGGRNILYKAASDTEIAGAHTITENELEKRVLEAKEILLQERAKRVRPGLDDKILTSWNALMITAYVDAYRAFDNQEHLDRALKNAAFINLKLKETDHRLYRSYKDGRASINAFLDDYAFTIEAFISLYQATFDETWVQEAQRLTAYAIDHFYDQDKGMFYYTSDIDTALIARKMDIADNVIPSSNSQMAKNLFLLGHYLYDNDYIEKSRRMLNNVQQNALSGGAYYANWDILMAWFAGGLHEVAIVGTECETRRKEFDSQYLPDVLFSGGTNEGRLPLLKDKLAAGQTTIYLCRDKVCTYPVTEVRKVLEQIFN